MPESSGKIVSTLWFIICMMFSTVCYAFLSFAFDFHFILLSTVHFHEAVILLFWLQHSFVSFYISHKKTSHTNDSCGYFFLCVWSAFLICAPGSGLVMLGIIIGFGIIVKTGRQYDRYGNMKQWWDLAAVERFKNKTKCMVDQYSEYQLHGEHVSVLLLMSFSFTVTALSFFLVWDVTLYFKTEDKLSMFAFFLQYQMKRK